MVDLPPIPPRIAALPRDHRGYPVPYFVAWVDGKPDHRIIDPNKMRDAVKFRKCWICGEPLGSHLAFVVGPMCSIHRISAEPPMHKECALFSVQACPFLSIPEKRRREKNLPDMELNMNPAMRPHNPGASLIWVTRKYQIIDVHDNILFDMGEPTECTWWARGEPALATEAFAALHYGYQFLRQKAIDDGEGTQKLDSDYVRAQTLLPK